MATELPYLIKGNSITLAKVPEAFESSFLDKDTVVKILEKWRSNPMLIPRISKVVINISVGGAIDRLEKASKLLEILTGQKPSLRRAKKTIREFGISRKQFIAAVVTLRGAKAHEFLRKALYAVNNMLNISNFDEFGNVSFGIREHLLLPGVKYDPEIGIFGMDVSVSLERPGYRVVRRRRCRSDIPRRHRVSKYEGVLFMEILYGIRVVGGRRG